MRPLELTIEGFRSYARRATFDLRGRRLVGVVGPIGSGKSSMLDAIAFALFGKTPTVERNTKSLINQRADGAVVELIFEVDGEVWKAVRGQRRSGQPPTQLQRLDGDGGEPIETITGREAMNERIERLLGLPFDAFRRSVLLAQNQFAEFLRARPGDRDDVLKGVFGFDAVDAALEGAKRRRDDAERDLEEFGRRRQELHEARDRLDEAEREARELDARRKELDGIAKGVAAAQEQLDAAQREAKELERRAAKLVAIAERVPSTESTDELLEETERLGRTLVRAETELREVDSALAKSERGLAAAIRKHGDRDLLTRGRGALALAAERTAACEDARGRLEEAGAELSERRARVTALEDGVKIAEANESRARAALEETAATLAASASALEDARHAEMAVTLRSGLVAGDTCPVCEQPVHALPRRRAAPKLQTANRAVARAQAKESKARGTLDDASAATATARAELKGARAELPTIERRRAQAAGALRKVEGALRDTRTSLDRLLGRGEHAARLETKERALDAAEEERGRTDAEAGRARAALETARAVVERARGGIQRLATDAATTAGRLDLEIDATPEPGALRAALASLRLACEERAGGLSDELEAASGRAVAAREDVAKLLESVGVAPDADFGEERTETRVHAERANARVAELKERIKGADKLAKDVRAAEARRETFAALVSDLQPSKFLRYLLQEERVGLAELGSEHFERLSGDRYRFTEDGAFDVVDLHAAEAVRKPESLSGGETFLASLALALALAEMVGRRGGRLDAFLLDEGFGSLDPEHLDLAMEGVGRLVADSSERLVVVVSHVPEMREAIEDLVVLDKDPVTGDTIVRSGAAPGA